MFWTVLLLIISNVFMTFAWYGHTKYPHSTLWKAIVISWLIAFFEYCFQVPANRIGTLDGHQAGQLKVVQEAITLVVFAVFSATFLHKPLTWNYYVAFALVGVAVFFVFHKW